MAADAGAGAGAAVLLCATRLADGAVHERALEDVVHGVVPGALCDVFHVLDAVRLHSRLVVMIQGNTPIRDVFQDLDAVRLHSRLVVIRGNTRIREYLCT